MLDVRTALPAVGRRRGAAALAAAALGAAVLAPPTPATAAPACPEARPYGASASADLLRLGVLDLRPLALPIGPVADVQIAATGAGLAADAEVTAAAAARDVAAQLLGLEVLGSGPVGPAGSGVAGGVGLGRTVRQQAPPNNAAPVTGSGTALDLGVVRARLGDTSAHATWEDGMRCGARTGPAGAAAASLIDGAVLPAPGGRALVALPHNLASNARTGLVEVDGAPASRATATASLTDLRLFAGSDSEIAVKVISEPALAVTATGRPGGSSVDYHAPLLEISGPGTGTHRLESPGTHLDLALPIGTPVPGLPVIGGGDPLGGLTDTVGALAGISTGPRQAGSAQAGPPLELAGLPGVAAMGELPALGDVLRGVSTAIDDLVILRLSLGHLAQRVDGATVSASAASLRLQLLAWDGEQVTEQSRAAALLDLGIGLLQAAATAPAPANPPGPTAPGGGCGECGASGGTGGGGGELPVTGSLLTLLAGAGAVLTVVGGLLLAVSGRIRRAPTR